MVTFLLKTQSLGNTQPYFMKMKFKVLACNDYNKADNSIDGKWPAGERIRGRCLRTSICPVLQWGVSLFPQYYATARLKSNQRPAPGNGCADAATGSVPMCGAPLQLRSHNHNGYIQSCAGYF